MRKIVMLQLVAMGLLVANCGGEKKRNSKKSAQHQTQTPESPPVQNKISFAEEQNGSLTTVKGRVTGLDAGKKIYIERKEFESNETIKVIELAADASFEYTLGIEQAGIYRMRMGLVPIYMVLEGGESVELAVTIEEQQLKSCVVKGSEQTARLQQLMNQDGKALATAIRKSSNEDVLVNLTVVERLAIKEHIEAYKKVRNQLVATYPNWSYTQAFGVKVDQVEALLTAAGSSIKVGDKAPDIVLENPDGKKYRLSELKGKVVLIDFWASWCRPCRMENPNLVRVYNKYKNKGFTVFSVSLDGLDSRKRMLLGNDPQRLEQARQQQKNRWVQAIKEDGLAWPYHVSELRSWSSHVARTYQVSSIPKAFLVDREGKIRFSNPSQLRGPALEQAVKSLVQGR